jgi:hypothetical protein
MNKKIKIKKPEACASVDGATSQSLPLKEGRKEELYPKHLYTKPT